MSKVAVITGANKGIGKEIALKIGMAGYRTIIACRNDALGAEAADELIRGGVDAEFRNCDIDSSASMESFVRGLEADYPAIDILVNNAAIAFKGSDPTPFQEQAEPTIRVNYFGTVELTQRMLPLLKRASAPRIVMVASMAGHLKILKSQDKVTEFTNALLSVDELNELMKSFVIDVQSGDHHIAGWPDTCYGMSKLGVIALTKILARDEPSILVNCCCPGYCATDMSSHRGHKTAEEGARTPALLALLPPDSTTTGKFYSDEREIEW